jgi:hypothetical protein
MNQGALKPLVGTQYLTNAAATYYTVPQAMANSIAVVHSLVIANTDTAAHTFTIHNVASGDSATNGNRIFAGVQIPANTTWIGRYPEEGAFIMAGGGTLQAFADANSVITLSIGGREYQ